MTLYNAQGQPLSAQELQQIQQAYSAGSDNVPAVYDENGNALRTGAGNPARAAVGQALTDMGFTGSGGYGVGGLVDMGNGRQGYILDAQKAAQAQASGIPISYVNGTPVVDSSLPGVRGVIGSNALFPDMPQKGLGGDLMDVAPVLLAAAGGSLAGLSGFGGAAGGAGGLSADTLASIVPADLGSTAAEFSPLAGVGGGAGAAGAAAGGLADAGSSALPGLMSGAEGGFDVGMGGNTAAALGLGGGAAGAGLGAGAASAGASALSPLARLLGLGQTGSDALSVLGPLAGSALGYLGSQQQQNAYQDVANQQLAIGAPYRNQLAASYQPGFDLTSQPGYGDAFNRLADISARSYSSSMGNPADNPTAQAGILSDVWNQGYLPALTNYRGQLGQFGGLGLNTSGTASLAGASQAGGGLNAIGYGLGSVTQPQNNLQSLLQQLGGNQNLSLNVGGLKYGG